MNYQEFGLTVKIRLMLKIFESLGNVTNEKGSANIKTQKDIMGSHICHRKEYYLLQGRHCQDGV